MGRVLDCPVCNAWATIRDTRTLKPGIVRRKYECANEHRFITMSAEVVIAVWDPKPPKGTHDVKTDQSK